MAEVTVTINGRGYRIVCDDGQEEHVERLAARVDKRVGDLVASVGQVGDGRLLVMASLLIADEVSDLGAELERVKSELAGGRESGSLAVTDGGDIAALDAAARRIEDIVARLESA
ncbi:MAG: cell division protein ZapA [Alphaproteobacteria bacterium]